VKGTGAEKTACEKASGFYIVSFWQTIVRWKETIVTFLPRRPVETEP